MFLIASIPTIVIMQYTSAEKQSVILGYSFFIEPKMSSNLRPICGSVKLFYHDIMVTWIIDRYFSKTSEKVLSEKLTCEFQCYVSSNEPHPRVRSTVISLKSLCHTCRYGNFHENSQKTDTSPRGISIHSSVAHNCTLAQF